MPCLYWKLNPNPRMNRSQTALARRNAEITWWVVHACTDARIVAGAGPGLELRFSNRVAELVEAPPT